MKTYLSMMLAIFFSLNAASMKTDDEKINKEAHILIKKAVEENYKSLLSEITKQYQTKAKIRDLRTVENFITYLKSLKNVNITKDLKTMIDSQSKLYVGDSDDDDDDDDDDDPTKEFLKDHIFTCVKRAFQIINELKGEGDIFNPPENFIIQLNRIIEEMESKQFILNDLEGQKTDIPDIDDQSINLEFKEEKKKDKRKNNKNIR